MSYRVYLSGEIHSNWRQEISDAVVERKLAVELSAPVCDHAASDDVGVRILGDEPDHFWKDHKAAQINAVRIRKHIDEADIVVVKFGDQYRQWNAAFDAGYAAARGKSIIVLHDASLTHALKEVDAAAAAVAETPQQVVEIMDYLLNA